MTQPSYRKPILIVDDEPGMLETLEDCLRSMGYTALTTSDPVKVPDLVRDKGIEIVVLDIQMPRMDGFQVLTKLKELDQHIAPIVMTAHGSIERAVEAMKRGAYDFLAKPFGIDVFMLTIQQAVERVGLIRQNETLTEQIRQLQPDREMVGTSRALERIRDMVRRVAPSDVTVLITGESGTGKELIADSIVRHSTRANRPFVKINCAALPETLLESELFGHERGAFTGAVSRQIGKFEMADGGTLFLDEIGEMSLSIQSKLLRIIQEQCFQRLGGHQNIQVDVRLIAATNKELKKEIERQNFREDLFYRLNVIEIQLPALRERPEDVPLLIEHVLGDCARKHRKPRVHFSPAALEKLGRFTWPGNIRQLRNYLERVTLLNLGDDLDRDVDNLVDGPAAPVQRVPEIELETLASLDEAEAVYIQRVLSETRGNRTQAAQILKIDPKTLRAKIKKAREFGIVLDGD